MAQAGTSPESLSEVVGVAEMAESSQDEIGSKKAFMPLCRAASLQLAEVVQFEYGEVWEEVRTFFGHIESAEAAYDRETRPRIEDRADESESGEGMQAQHTAEASNMEIERNTGRGEGG